MSKYDVYILDENYSIVTVADIPKDHFFEMVRRGWITPFEGLVEEDETVSVMSVANMINFLQEVS